MVNNWNVAAAQNYLVYNSTTAPNGDGAGFLGLQTSNCRDFQLSASSESVGYPRNHVDSVYFWNLYAPAYYRHHACSKPWRYQLTCRGAP